METHNNIIKRVLTEQFERLLFSKGWPEEVNQGARNMFNALLEELDDREDLLQQSKVYWREEEKDIVVVWENQHQICGFSFSNDGFYASGEFHDKNGNYVCGGSGGDETFYGSILIDDYTRMLKDYFGNI